MHPSSSIVIEERNFSVNSTMSSTLACFMKAEIWVHKSCAVIFIDCLASTTNQSNNIVIEEPELSLCRLRSS